MALWNVDKNHSMRLNPVTSNLDKLPDDQRMSHGTTQITLRDEGDSLTVRVALKDGKIVVYDASGNLIKQEGFRDSDAEGAFEVAKPGQSL